MSAEGKKKRGLSGQANAKSIPFRYGGRPANYSTTLGHAVSRCGNGSRLVQAMVLGIRLPGFSPSEQLLQKTEEAMGRCTSSLLTYEAATPYRRAAE